MMRGSALNFLRAASLNDGRTPTDSGKRNGLEVGCQKAEEGGKWAEQAVVSGSRPQVLHSTVSSFQDSF